jgi:hypothetical protein
MFMVVNDGFVTHNKTFSNLNVFTFVFFSIIFLVEKMAHNAPHLLKFRQVYSCKKIIKSK